MLKGTRDSGHRVRALEYLAQVVGMIHDKTLLEGGSQ
jgi:hypothetical protein